MIFSTLPLSARLRSYMLSCVLFVCLSAAGVYSSPGSPDPAGHAEKSEKLLKWEAHVERLSQRYAGKADAFRKALNAPSKGSKNGIAFLMRVVGSKLSYAEEKACLPFLDMLLKKGADVRSRDENGKTPLHYACRRGNYLLASRLLQERNIEVNAPDQRGRTPLFMAIQAGYAGSKTIEALAADKRTNLNLRSGGTTALIYAVEQAQEEAAIAEVVGCLLAIPRLNASLQNEQGQTALEVAGKRGLATVAAMLIQAEEAKESTGWYFSQMVHFYSRKEKKPLAPISIRLFLKRLQKEHGANKEGLVQALTQPLLGNEKGTTLLMLAITPPAGLSSDEAFVAELLELGADPNAGNATKDTALHLAVCAPEKESIVRLLLSQAGINPNAANQAGDTPLLLAADTLQNESILQLLLDDPRVSPAYSNAKGCTVLHILVRSQEDHGALISKLLADTRLEVRKTDNKGYTALAYAKKLKKTDLISLLTHQHPAVPRPAASSQEEDPQPSAPVWKGDDDAPFSVFA